MTEEGEQYSPERIYTKSTDGRGHSERATVNLPPDLLAGLGRMIASKLIPEYRTTADFVRDSVMHRLKFWEDRIEHGWEPALTSARALEEIESRKAELMGRRSAIKALEELVTYAVEERDLTMLSTATDSARHYAEVFGKPWADELEEIATRAEKNARDLRALRAVK